MSDKEQKEKGLKCTCGGEMVIDRSDWTLLRRLSGSIPFLKCLKCGRTGGYADWGRNLFPIQELPQPKGLFYLKEYESEKSKNKKDEE